MADFTLTIGVKPSPQYVVTALTLFVSLDCDASVIQYPIGLLENTETPSITYWLLQSYSNPTPWKTIKIKNIVYSDGLEFFLSDTLVKIPEAGATVYDFDITGQTVDTAIADLTVTKNNPIDLKSRTINFDVAIEDTNNVVGTYQSVQLTLKYLECPPTTPFEDITLTLLNNDNCYVAYQVDVNVPAEEERYVTIEQNDARTYYLGTTLPVTISSTTSWTLECDRVLDLLGPISSITLRVFLDATQSTSIGSYTLKRKNSGNVC